MTVETATFINQLDQTLPAGSDSRAEGDNHLRLIKSTIKATFPNVTGAATPTQVELNYLVGVTSLIQTQLNAKAALAGATFTGTIRAPKVEAYDANSYLDVYDAGGAQFRSRWLHDTGDSIEYRRSNNDWLFRIGSSTIATLDATTFYHAGIIQAGSIYCQAETAYNTVGITLEATVTQSEFKAFKDPFGIVYLSGDVFFGSPISSATMFTLPAGWRPAQSCRFVCGQAGQSATITATVNSAGTVFFQCQAGITLDNGVSLEPINFRAA